MASISVSAITYTSATITITADSSASRIWTLYLDGSLYAQTSKLDAKISHSFHVVGLSAGTLYTVQGRYGPTTGDEYPGTASSTTTTFNTLSYPADSATVSISNIMYDSAVISVTGITSRNYSRTVRCNVNGELQTYALSSGQTSCSFIYTGLSANTTYAIDVGIRVINSDISTRTWRDQSKSFTTKSSYTLTMGADATANNVTLYAYISASQGADITVVFYLREAGASTYRQLTKTITAGSVYQSCKFSTDIYPATVYNCYVVEGYSGQTAPHNTAGYLNKRTKNNFAWTGGAKVKGEEFSLLASDWNEFTSQLKAKETYFTTTDNRTFTTAIAGSNFTADMFNQAVTAINNIVMNGSGDSSTTMSTVSAGDKITAAIINRLVTCLNE